MILACLFLFVGMAVAQTAVTGTVVSSEDGQPVIGATVKIVGTKGGTITDANGRFSLTLPSGHNKLQVTYVGMLPQTVTVKGNSVKVSLTADNTDLDEVMVVAYGTAKKSAFTGSAAVVKSDDIAKISSSNALSALTGKVSGVQINSATGAPGGESFSIRIRGISSASSSTNNDPLVIVDGAPYDGGDLNNINQNDIASMTVLKDAASAALYGARGANGVVIITTKNAEQGKTAITVDAKWGANSRGVEFYNTVESPAAYYETYYKALKNFSIDGGNSEAAAHTWALNNMFSGAYDLGYNVYTVPEGQDLIGVNGRLNPNATLGRVLDNGYMIRPDSWRDAIYQTGLRQEYNVTATGSNNNGSFYGSVGYLKNEGISVGSDYTRFTGRLKADYQLRPWLKVGGNFNYAHYNANSLSDDGGSTVGNVFIVKDMAPIYPLYIRDSEGNVLQDPRTGLPQYDWGEGSITGLRRPTLINSNPLFANYFDKNENEGNSLDATGFAEIRFLKDFKFTTSNTVMLDEARGTSTENPFYGQFAGSGGISKGHVRNWTYNYQQLLNWHHLFDKHDVEVMLGHEYYRKRYYTLSANKTNMFTVSNTELAGAVTVGSMNSYTTDYNVEGYFGRVLYNYDEKYFGSVSYRRDASSRFHPDHRWGNFWSVGGGWLINKESWFNAPWVDELKFKMSYGEQGNDGIPNYLYTNTYTIKPAAGSVSLTPSSTMGNKNITWEKGANFNTGFEFSLFRGRLSGSIEYFYRKTTDMLDFFALPVSSGYSGYYDNIGDMRNTGVEIELNGTVIRNKDFEWGLNANFTAYSNKILTIADDNKTMEVEGVSGYASDGYFYGEGKPLYTFYMPKYAGVDQETGRALYYKDVTKNVLDSNNNPVFDSEGKPVTEIVRETTDNPSDATDYLCGTALPWAYGGFGTSLSWKGFDLSVDFTYQLGGQIYDGDYAGMMGMTATGRGSAIHADLLNSWSADNKSSNIPRLVIDDVSATTTSDRFLTSASYLSFQNLNVGYTFPTKLISKIGINNLRLYLTATNLWLWSKRQGLDPRQSITGGASSKYYSAMRTISGGISVTF